MPIVIYGLYDPRTDELRYIGKTSTSLEGRLWQHINDAKKGRKTYKSDWIKLLLQFGAEPYIRVLGETTEEAWQEDEKAWIAKAKAEGIRLTNLTEGGDGLIGFRHTKRSKKKISEHNKKVGKIPPSWKGRKQSPEHIQKRVEARKKRGTYTHTEESKEKISKANKGKNVGHTYNVGFKHTEESKRKRSEASKGQKNHFFGRKHSEETKRKISENRKGKNLGNTNAKGNKGNKLSPERIERLREVNTGKTHSEETKQKLREANLGKKHTEEAKRKMGEASKRAWAKRKAKSASLTQSNIDDIADTVLGRLSSDG